MKIEIRKEDLFLGITALIISVFCTSGDLLSVIFRYNAVFGFIALFAILTQIVAIFISSSVFGITRDGLKLLVAISFMTIVMFYNCGWDIASRIIYLAGLMTVLVSLYFDGLFKYILKICIIVYLFYAICTIFFFFNRDFYLNVIVNIFQPEKRNLLISLYNSGYMAGLTAHYSTNAMLLSAGLILSFSFFLSYRKKSYFIYFIIISVALLLTGKRAHILFSVISIFILYYVSLNDTGHIKRIASVFGVSLLSIIFLYLIVRRFNALGIVFTRFGFLSSGNGYDDNIIARFRLWDAAFESFKTSPILGIGWKQYRLVISPRIMGYALNPYDVHNIYLQLLCETGIVGFLIYVIWFIYCIVISIQAYGSLDYDLVDVSDRNALLFSISYQSFFLMYGLTGNPLYEYITFLPYFISCGIGLYYNAKLKNYV